MEIKKCDYPLSIDFDALRNQKKHLLDIQMHGTITAQQSLAIEGIYGIIDTIQDYAVDTLGYKEEEVFGNLDTPDGDSIILFLEKWGQTTEEITANLGYNEEGSDDLLMVDYFYYQPTEKWYPICNSTYTEKEQQIADTLRRGV